MLHDYAPSVGVFEEMVWTQELPNTMSHCRVQTYVIACVSYRKRVQHRSIKSVQDTDHSSVAGNENLFPVVAEFDSGPFTDPAEPCLKGSKGAL